MTTPLNTLRALLLAGLLGTSALSVVQAAQFITVRDGDSSIASMSLRDPTRITLQGGKIVDVVGDVYDQTRNPNGRVTVMTDAESGEVFVQPVLVGGAGYQAVTLTLKTDLGTYSLLLKPLDMPADAIVMQSRGKALPPGAARATNSYSQEPARGQTPEFTSSSYVRSIKGWMLAMASNRAPEAVDVRRVDKRIALWSEVTFTLDDSWVGKAMVGDRFTLTNVSDRTLILDEREFYRNGVLAVTVFKHQVEPGTSTPVWVLRTRSEQD
ncbi:MAG: type-F conjugative transfer system secretin TraK [Aquabacterium sp.]|uniref:TraK domain-containing protein n=1 Tax=Aquabacterium sp. TaxID=1872578 RepID=UPI001DA7D9D0|nr:type-F conjugative transfer system secretin TraK [Aquabacterium sp.]MBT9609388.1 type-F conjugative transfer system secretin TraK [Aquabacterium sp.]|tara:strand:- start:1863 stop:2666 length:804 start_codon:yes stop_codon:yes gene_type:complete